MAGRWLLVFLMTLPFYVRGNAQAELTVEDYEAIGEALRVIELDDWPRAVRLMDLVNDPLAAKLFRWVTLVEGKGDPSFDTLATFIIDNPDWPRLDELQQRAEARLTDSADKNLTYTLFDLREPQSTRGRIRLAEAMLANGRADKGALQVRRAWMRGHFSSREEQRFYERHQRHLLASDHLRRLEQMLWDRDLRAAQRMLDRVPEPYARLAEARIALQSQSPGVDRAIEAVPAELQNDAGLVYDRIRWRRLKQKHEGARELLLLDPPEKLVRPERWWFERSFQVRRAIRERNFELAYELVRRHGQKRGGDYAEAEWLSGWLALRFVNQPDEAFRHFVRLYDRVSAPVRQARAAYWAARAATSLGDEAGAVAWYRRAALQKSSYYGQLAWEELGGRTATASHPEPTEAERAAFDAGELASVARLLIAAGDRRYLGDFLSRLAQQAETAIDIDMIADYAKAAGRPVLLARLGRRAAFAGKVHEETSFPIPRITGLLEPAADVDPALLLGVARQESMFRSKAVSPAGARGLLQLIPSTARIMAARTLVPYDGARLIADPDYNAFLGAYYLESLIERFDGSLPLALAGYNAGPLRVGRWLERHGDPRTGDRYDVIDWIELIPFDETRNYVQRVMEGYSVYKRRLAKDDVEMIDYPGFNRLHPPPVPTIRPADLAGGVNVIDADEDAELAVHRPRLKPLERDRLVAGGADDRSLDQPVVKSGFGAGRRPETAVDETGG